ncbi:ATP-binding cassette domain-containing protein [Uliginosibacterium aquaticum]|uniref:ATP-binding cassette domain-containing protein n=1 Tax=Uliginosibacterium aquaticum TaxID=2731212 RepID=A0ABX2IJH0_9RHOO|nr:ATP-binding cassette domain-containing protein [Uliginosibacterium aquaticum]NSL56885.1 ATP-binding cassette domain-containing protein [Uliginosibacterium aquaticum]
MPLLIENLHKHYGELEVVRGISLQLQPGECFALLGPNGAGKTTTLRCVLGHTEPSAGSIELCGLPVPARAREARAKVGVVPQSDSLDPDFTVTENLLTFARYFGLSREAAQARVPELLTFAGLEAKAEAKVPALSGGMKRRLTMARALVADPDLLIMDEPTTGLDPQARHLIWDRLKGLIAQGKTIFLTTHFMDEAERLAHRIAILDRGQIIAMGTPREVIAAHIEPQVVEVFGEWAGHEGGAAAWAAAHAGEYAQRFEVSGETAFCYLEHPEALLAHLAAQGGLRTLHRPANLEDVFLKLTGREMRDE